MAPAAEIVALAAEIGTKLFRRWWPIGLLTMLSALSGLAYGVASDPVYTANAYVVVVAQNPGDSLIVSYAQAYARIADQGATLNAAADASTGTASVRELRQQVQASASPDAPVIEIAGSANSARRAADMANLVANGLAITANAQSADTGVRLSLLSAAAPPADPTSPRLGLDVAVGAAVGLLLGGLALLAKTDLSPRPRHPKQPLLSDPFWAANATATVNGHSRDSDLPVVAPLAPTSRDRA
jgi:capsular polysaccharide biosynthesis protein